MHAYAAPTHLRPSTQEEKQSQPTTISLYLNTTHAQVATAPGNVTVTITALTHRRPKPSPPPPPPDEPPLLPPTAAAASAAAVAKPPVQTAEEREAAATRREARFRLELFPVPLSLGAAAGAGDGEEVSCCWVWGFCD